MLLTMALREEGIEAFLIALCGVAAAQGGIMARAKSTGLTRESLRTHLIPEGRRTFMMIVAVVQALGMQIEVGLAKPAPA